MNNYTQYGRMNEAMGVRQPFGSLLLYPSYLIMVRDVAYGKGSWLYWVAAC